MPFQYDMRSYTRESVISLNTNQSGVYGIFRGDVAVYIGSGDIRERLLAHLGGDKRCIVRENPNLWTAEVFRGDATGREGELIREYQPLCNAVIPR